MQPLTTRYLVGDVFEMLEKIPDNSVDLVMTSPPFLALRSYLPADHPDKAREIGSEATPGEFIDRLIDVVEALAPKLTRTASLVFELGDTYSGSGGSGGDYNEGGFHEGQQRFRQHNLYAARADGLTFAEGGANVSGKSLGSVPVTGGRGWPLDKSLTLIPQSFAWALAYGRNPFNGRETERWRIRNLIVWARPNPPVGALSDKVRPATSYLTVATMARDRWFDMDAVRVVNPNGQGVGKPAGRRTGQLETNPENGGNHVFPVATSNPAGAPLLDYWEIPTQGYKFAHFATFPEELPRRVILSMCPEKVCVVCGEPSRRITGAAEYERTDSNRVPARLTMTDGERPADGVNQHVRRDGANTSVIAVRPTIGWTDCGCPGDHWRPGLVLDPFAGSGTTLRMALGNGRSSVGIDLDARNADLALDRVGPLYMEVE